MKKNSYICVMITNEEKNTPNYNVFCDLDGVLVDFDRGYEELTGENLKGIHRSDNNFWEPIKKAGYDFWFNLKWTQDGKELWDYIKKYTPSILSAPSREPESRVGKFDWVKKEIPMARLILRSAKNKKYLASPNSILIDDRIDNINDWIEFGGIGILHTSTENTIKELKKINL